MDVEDFNLAVDYISGNGTIFSIEQKVILQNSLLRAKRNYKFSSIRFWGKIQGVKHDYFIAYGVANDEFNEKIFLYSQNCIDWHLLPRTTNQSVHRFSYVTQRLIGDPAHSHLFSIENRVNNCQNNHDDDKYYNENNTESRQPSPLSYHQILEEDLLAAIVAKIDRETSIVPKGAFVKNPLGKVQVNRTFRGLSTDNSQCLSSYVHFHPAHKRKTEFYKNRGDCDPSLDFANTIDKDLKNVSWSLRLERGSFVCLRHLRWLGMTFYHVPNTNSYGSLYVGDGQENVDLPFML